jgi:3'-phosphoadenosine 5'-phosphosulfate sulfotransferase (PAPS reductase)/FAD synthetase
MTEVSGAAYVCYSGGKDSEVLLDIARSIYPDIIGVFSNTTNEFSEILRHVKKHENIVTVKPAMNFVNSMKKNGFPIVDKKNARKIRTLRNPTDKNHATRHLYLTGIKRDGTTAPSWKLAQKWRFLLETPYDTTEQCCDILKKKPLQKFEKESGLYPITGVMAAESNQREKNLIQFGENITDGSKKVCRPMAIWTNDDIWAYIKENDLEICEIYYDKEVTLENGETIVVPGEKRTGCAYCAYGAHLEKKDEWNRFQRLKLRRPQQFENLMKIENNGVTFREALSDVGVEIDPSILKGKKK